MITRPVEKLLQLFALILNRSTMQKAGYRKLGGKGLGKVPLMKGAHA